MIALISNDDGIHSVSMHILVQALIQHGWQVYVSAPDKQQSGIGRAMPFHENISVTEFHGIPGCVAWAVSATPLVCVNIALSHLIKERPNIVISGINWGVNVSIPVIFSSGTVSAAIEGATFGIPSLSVSQSLPGEEKKLLQVSHGAADNPQVMQSIHAAVKHTVHLADIIAGTSDPVVHNVNFPCPTTDSTQIMRTTIADVMRTGAFPAYGSLFSKNTQGQYVYDIQQDMSLDPPEGTDVHCLLHGMISHSVLDLRVLCK